MGARNTSGAPGHDSGQGEMNAGWNRDRDPSEINVPTSLKDHSKRRAAMSQRSARAFVFLAALLGVLWGVFEWHTRQAPGGAEILPPETVRSAPPQRSPIERVLTQAEIHDPAAFEGARALLAAGILPEERADLLVAAARGALAGGRLEEGDAAAAEALEILADPSYMPAFSGSPTRLRQEALLLQSRARMALGRADAEVPLEALAQEADLTIRIAAREALLHLTAARLGAAAALDAHAEALLADERAARGRPHGQTLAFLALLDAAAGRDPAPRAEAARAALGWDQAAPPQGLTPTGLEGLAPTARLERLRPMAEAAAAQGDRARAARLVLAAAEALLDLGDRRGAFEGLGRAIALAEDGAADAVLAAAAIPYLLLGGDEIDGVALLTSAQRAAGRAYGPASPERGALLLALAEAAARQGLAATEGQALQSLAMLAALSPGGPDIEAAAAAYARLAGARVREGRRAEAEAAARAARALIQSAAPTVPRPE